MGGDFNLPHIDWSIPHTIESKPNKRLHDDFLDTLNDFGLEQVVKVPTRDNHTLDLIATN